jgi:hypothetical protein
MIRTVFVPQNDSFVFPIPTEYIGKELEINIFPTDELPAGYIRQLTNDNPIKPLFPKKATFNAISLDTRQFTFNREEANARQS